MSVFIDTSAFFAVMDADDGAHARASETWATLVNGTEALVTSNYTLVETQALVQSRLGMAAVRLFYDRIVPVLDVLWVGEDTHQAAVGAVLVANRRHLSLVDCVSFVLMRQRGIEVAFTLDAHFAEQGLDVLP